MTGRKLRFLLLLFGCVLIYNIGVEAGQPLLGLIVILLLYLISYWRRTAPIVNYAGALLIACLGVYWIVEYVGWLK